MNLSTSTENCTNCQSSPAGAGSAQVNTPVTYNDGDGIKDKIVLTGPLSAAMLAAMDWVFEKKPMQLTPQPPALDGAAPAAESMVQDAHMEAMVAGMGSTPELSVVLSDFDVQSVKDHVEDAKADRLEPMPPPVTTVYVTNSDDITKQDTYAPMIEEGWRGIALVVGDMGGSGPIQPPTETTVTINEIREDEKLEQEGLKASIERLFEGTGVKVCFGFEAFAQEMAARKKKA